MLRAIHTPGVTVGRHLPSRSIPPTPSSGCKEELTSDPTAVHWDGGAGKEAPAQGNTPLHVGLAPK